MQDGWVGMVTNSYIALYQPQYQLIQILDGQFIHAVSHFICDDSIATEYSKQCFGIIKGDSYNKKYAHSKN